MAEVLLVIWTQWSRKPSDREISVSVRERANGNRQQENEKGAAAPGLRLKTAREEDGSPVVGHGLPVRGAPSKELPACCPAWSCTERLVPCTAGRIKESSNLGAVWLSRALFRTVPYALPS